MVYYLVSLKSQKYELKDYFLFYFKIQEDVLNTKFSHLHVAYQIKKEDAIPPYVFSVVSVF